MRVTALWLLGAGMAAQFTWAWAPTWAQADVWNAAGAIFIMLLLGLLGAGYRRFPAFVLVCVYLAALWLLTAGCSFLWLHAPWDVLPGQDQCDARLKKPLSVMGLFLGLIVAIMIRRAKRGQGTEH